MLSSFPFVHLKLHELRYHWKNWSDVINKGTYWLNKTIQTTPTKTFRNRCMKVPFPSHQPSVLHSSPLWLLACNTVLSELVLRLVKQPSGNTKFKRSYLGKKKQIHCPPILTVTSNLKGLRWICHDVLQPHLSYQRLKGVPCRGK